MLAQRIGTLAAHEPEPTAEAIIEGYKQLIARAHALGMRIIGATLTPFGDAFAGTPRGIIRPIRRRPAWR